MMTVAGPAWSIPKQIVVIKAPEIATRVSLEHVPGDRVARLDVTAPPETILDTLRSQLGTHFIGLRRGFFQDGVLRVHLILSSEAVDIDVQPVAKPRAFAISFTARDDAPPPDKEGFFARVPGLWLPDALPLAFPREPGDAPCPGVEAPRVLAWSEPAEDVEDRFTLVQDRVCADYLAGRLAARALADGRPLEPFEAWAFRFDPRFPWPNAPRAFALTLLTVGEVLLRTGYLPEAEVVLTEKGLGLASFRIQRALALANLAFQRDAFDEVEPLIAPATVLATSDRVRVALLELRLRALLSKGDTNAAIEVIEENVGRIEHPTSVDGNIFALAGEVALARGEHTRAAQLFRRGARSSAGPARTASRIRLGDLAARRGQWKTAVKRYTRAAPRTECLGAHVKLRRRIIAQQENRELERTLILAADRPACPSERRMAQYGLTYLYMQTGVPEQAVPLARAWTQATPKALRNADIERSLLRNAGRAAAERLERHQDWGELVDLWGTELSSIDGTDDPTKLIVAGAMMKLGLSQPASEILKGLVSKGVADELKDDVAALLAEAYLAMDDDYRASLVQRYFENQLGAGPMIWRIDQVAARISLLRADPEAAVVRMNVAAARTPAGDPEFARRILLVESAVMANRVEEGARELTAALRLPLVPAAKAELVIAVLSEALRREVPAAAELFQVVQRTEPEMISPRIAWRARRQGIATPEVPQDALVGTLSAAAEGPKPRKGNNQ